MSGEAPASRGWINRALVRNNGIARRLMLALVLLSSAITAVITAGELLLDYRNGLRDIDERIESIRAAFLPTLIESVWVAEGTQIQIQLDGLLNLGDIEYVAVVVDGRTAWSAGHLQSTRRLERVMSLERLHRGQKVHIGDLHVVGSVDQLLERLWSRLLLILVSNAIKTLLITAFMLLVFQALVGQHLELISAHLRSIGRNIGAAPRLALNRRPTGLWRPDALDHVAAAVNAMQDDIARSQAEVQALNLGLERRVDERTRELSAAKQAAEEASAAKSQFLSRMSHELRTPLNAILGFAEVLLLDGRQPVTPGQRTHLQRIVQAGGRLLLLIDDLLDLSRIESGSLHLRIEDVDPSAAIGDAVRELQPQADAAGVVLSVTAPAQVRVRADAARLRQVLVNLLSNAIKYNRPGGRVDIEARAQGGALMLSVTDTGLGMTREQLGALFSPFDRLGREALDVKGTGIGLVITRSLLDMMGSPLSVHSEPGAGSRFAFDLPLVTAPATVGDAPPAAAEPPPLRRDVHGRVLYIDDDEVNRALMEAFLALRPGVTLQLAPDGAAGVAAAAAARPDLVLVDMVMPGIGGVEVLHALRADSMLADVPCLAVSANAMPREVSEALQAGFDGYLTKPLAAAVLLAEIDRRLAPRAAAG